MKFLVLWMFLITAAAVQSQEPKVVLQPPPTAPAVSINEIVLEQINRMPRGGQYATSRVATIRLQAAAHFESGKFFIVPEGAAPSYCSGATYLVFLKTIEELRKRNAVNIPFDDLKPLIVKGQKDGEGIWGRWNANGPGTARLFHELRLGRNFTSYEEALPGDFMKIFWSTEVGKLERGHSVIYLGTEMKSGVEHVKFWSSNKPHGYGEKSVPKTQVKQAIFSRLETPANLAKFETVPNLDPYLANLLTTKSSFSEAKTKCGM